MRIQNFGKNLDFSPDQYLEPESGKEVLAILDRVRGKRIRAIGSLHAWSDAPREEEVILNLRRLRSVRVERRGGESWAIIEAGCQIKHAVAALDKYGLSLPSLGLITEQSLAGATATGTHGSGRHSLSHYVDEITIAHYDQSTGEPTFTTLHSGDELRAARCSLGCVGIVVSLGMRCRPQYRVEEHFRIYDRLQEVLDAEVDSPLQQFYLLPHLWKYLAQHRVESDKRKSRLADFYQIYWFLCVDVGLHVVLLALVRLIKSKRLIGWFYRQIAPLTVIRGWRVVDKSPRILTMEHELFRHIEIEIFVEQERLAEALRFSEQLIRHCAGDSGIDPAVREKMAELGCGEQFDDVSGRYVHHYPICVRKVLPDDTMLSMASGITAPYYALSFISYARPSERAGFFLFADLLARSTATLFDARPHWGKYCPIDAKTAARLYPELEAFRAVCEQFDAEGKFRNDWLRDVLFGEHENESQERLSGAETGIRPAARAEAGGSGAWRSTRPPGADHRSTTE